MSSSLINPLVFVFNPKGARPEDGRLNLMPKLNATSTGPVDLDEVEIDDESRASQL